MSIIYVANETLVIIGSNGSDAPSVGHNVATGEVVPIPGWEAIDVADILAASRSLEAAGHLKDSHLQGRVTGPLVVHIHGELVKRFG